MVPVEGDENGASAIPDVDVSRSDGHDKAPEGAQAVLGLWSSAPSGPSQKFWSSTWQ
ncbi:MAG: hypothetical protein V2A73_19335 [Pseudomonadota bacterium]